MLDNFFHMEYEKMAGGVVAMEENEHRVSGAITIKKGVSSSVTMMEDDLQCKGEINCTEK